MVWLRKSLVAFLAFILFISLLSGVSSVAINHTVGKPETVKKLISKSKIYDKAVEAVLSSTQADNNQKGQNDGSISLNDPAVQGAAKEAFSPPVLQKSVEIFIDGNYGWLSGKTATPDFKIDLTQAKQEFANIVGKNVQTRLNSLKVCTAAQEKQLQIPVDVMTVTCRPANLNPIAESTRISTQIMTSDFLTNPVITADSFAHDPKDPKSKPYYQKLSRAPEIYQAQQQFPLALGFIAFISAMLIIFVSATKRKGIKRVAWVFLSAGTVLIISKFLAGIASHQLRHLTSNGTVITQLKQPRDDFINLVQQQFTQTYLVFGLAFIIIAVITYAALFLTKSKQNNPKIPKPAPIDDKPVPEPVAQRRNQPTMDISGPVQKPSTAPVFKTPPPAPKKPRPPRLIQ